MKIIKIDTTDTTSYSSLVNTINLNPTFRVKTSEDIESHYYLCGEGETLCTVCFHETKVGEILYPMPIAEAYLYYTASYCEYHYSEYVY